VFALGGFKHFSGFANSVGIIIDLGFFKLKFEHIQSMFGGEHECIQEVAIFFGGFSGGDRGNFSCFVNASEAAVLN